MPLNKENIGRRHRGMTTKTDRTRRRDVSLYQNAWGVLDSKPHSVNTLSSSRGSATQFSPARCCYFHCQCWPALEQWHQEQQWWCVCFTSLCPKQWPLLQLARSRVSAQIESTISWKSIMWIKCLINITTHCLDGVVNTTENTQCLRAGGATATYTYKMVKPLCKTGWLVCYTLNITTAQQFFS